MNVQGMKGIVFAEFLDMVERHHGLEVVDAMLQAAAPASGGAYTSVNLRLAGTGAACGSVGRAARWFGCRGAARLRTQSLRGLRAAFPGLLPRRVVAAAVPRWCRNVDPPRGLEALSRCRTAALRGATGGQQPHAALPVGAATGALRAGAHGEPLRHFGDTHELAADGAAGNWTFRVREREEVPCQSAR